MDPLIVTQAINVLYGISTLAVLALGLAVIFGLLGVLNIAHGEFVMIGAYCAYVAQAGGLPYLAAVPLTLAVCAVLGVAVEWIMIRPLYRRPFDTLVATWGLSLLLRKIAEAIFGLGFRSVSIPLPGTVKFAGTEYPIYRLLLIAISIAVVAALVVWYGRSRTGSRIRAMVSNPELAQAQGISVRWLAAGTFVTGTCLAGLGGVMIAPLVPVQPFMGLDYVLRAFFVLIVGGLGSVAGLLSGATVIGGVDSVISAATNAANGYFAVLVLAILSFGSGREGSLRAASVVVLIAIALPFLLGQFWAYQLGLYALYAAAAVGVGLCWGQAGFLPLGQALFFGLAAYLSGLAFIALAESPVLAVLVLPLTAIISGVLAYLIGIVIFRRSGESGAYFSMITLALALLAFQVATSWNSVTGGFNGLKGIPGLPGLDDISDVYYVAASALLAVLALGAWLYNAPIGVLWRALAQNERRLKLFGFDTDQLKAVAFGVSGLMAGIGGAIYAPQQGIVTPQVIGFGLSADLVIWAAVGGRASLLGPVIGTLVVGSLTAQLRDSLPFWEVLMAVFFIAIVLVFPRGIVGFADPLIRRFPQRKRAKAALAAPGDAAARPPAKLVLNDVSVHVGEVTILDKLSVDFEEAGIFCVIGPNGAGKTSMFNVVSGELATAAGAVDLGGLKIAGLAPNQVSGLGVARKLQIPSVFPELSIADNLAVALWSARARKLALLDPRLRRWTSPMLKELQSRYPFLAAGQRKAAELSHGEQQILELAMALLTEPRVLLLDEPCAGLSPEETSAVMGIIRWAAERLRGSIIIIEHDMSLVKELAQIVYVLHNGALLAKGNVAAIQADPAVRAVYVGGEK